MESSSTFSGSLTTATIVPQQQPVVWSLSLPTGSEGPTLISHVARLLPVGLTAFFLRRRGAPSSA